MGREVTAFSLAECTVEERRIGTGRYHYGVSLTIIAMIAVLKRPYASSLCAEAHRCMHVIRPKETVGTSGRCHWSKWSRTKTAPYRQGFPMRSDSRTH